MTLKTYGVLRSRASRPAWMAKELGLAYQHVPVVGGRFTVADLNVAEIIRYAQAAPELFTDAPNVQGWTPPVRRARPLSR